MPFEQGGVQGPAQQMIFDGGGLHFGRDGGGLHFGRGRSTTARVEENGKIRANCVRALLKLAWTSQFRLPAGL